jgi:sulfatase maturation enzyme AslB (radical SAM superfamily)
MNAELPQLCEILRAEGIRLTLLSTGLLLKKCAGAVASNFDDVIVSLDGPPAIHDMIRRVSGAFDLLQSGVRALKEIRPDLRISARSTVQKANHGCLRETARAAKGLGLDQISFLAVDVSSPAFNRALVWPMERQVEMGLSLQELSLLEAGIEALIRDGAGEFARNSACSLPSLRFAMHRGLQRCWRSMAAYAPASSILRLEICGNRIWKPSSTASKRSTFVRASIFAPTLFVESASVLSTTGLNRRCRAGSWRAVSGIHCRFAKASGRWQMPQVNHDRPQLLVRQDSSPRRHSRWRNAVDHDPMQLSICIGLHHRRVQLRNRWRHLLGKRHAGILSVEAVARRTIVRKRNSSALHVCRLVCHGILPVSFANRQRVFDFCHRSRLPFAGRRGSASGERRANGKQQGWEPFVHRSFRHMD